MPGRPENPIHLLNVSRTEQRRLRAETLVALASGMIDMWDVLTLAATPEGVALRAIPIAELLWSRPAWTHRITAATMRAFYNALSLPRDIPVRRLRVGFLIDRRCHSRRVMALVDAMSTIERPLPAPRFPFTSVWDVG